MSAFTEKPPSWNLPDQAQRDDFINHLDHNTTVIAPAGVGKTFSIVSRIVALAQHPRALECLPQLVVVTYTKRAAQEMQSRAREKILQENLGAAVESAFHRAFFGTIHQFCLRFVQAYGHHLGIPSPITLLDAQDRVVWQRFLQTTSHSKEPFHPTWHPALLRLVPATHLYRLARQLVLLPQKKPPIPEPPPPLKCDELLAYTPSKKTSLATIQRSQQAAHQFLLLWEQGIEFVTLPPCQSRARDFLPLWESAFYPLRAWMEKSALEAAYQIAHAYREFRWHQGTLTFADQIAAACSLLNCPEAAAAIRSEKYHVILDEAQDTDPLQFRVLTEITQTDPTRDLFSEPGRWAMVGDPQQCIYSDRADLATYLKLDQQVRQAPSSQGVEFSVTFRCDRQIVAFLNQTFPPLLNGQHGQVNFVPLQPRPNAGPGQVIRLPIPSPSPPIATSSNPSNQPQIPPPIQATTSQKQLQEARFLATWVRDQGYQGLGAQSWKEVAILCPRKRQFIPLRRAFREVGLDLQQQSFRSIHGDNPAYAWLTSLVWVATHPRDHYEIVGVLREVFGISDHELALFCQGEKSVWQIETPPPSRGFPQVETALQTLQETTNRLTYLPLREAIEQLIAPIELRQRLNLLDQEDTEELQATLDRLIIQSSQAEARGETLLSWAEQQRQRFFHICEDQALPREAIQLITCQKAKGLEWDVVIIPFFFQPIVKAAPPYPRLVHVPNRPFPRLLLSSNDSITDEAGFDSNALLLAEQQQKQRLLYVTMTRARHTLVLIDDAAFFSPQRPSSKNHSFGDLLLTLPHQANASTWKNLPATLSPTSPQQILPSISSSASQPSPFPSLNLSVAQQHAQAFPQRLTPHQLALHPSPTSSPSWATDDDRPELNSLTPGTRYGTWWHELMEIMPWQKGPSACQEKFLSALVSSPDPQRSEKEWNLLLASPLLPQLTCPEAILKPEISFLWNSSKETIIEGVIDLALYLPSTQQWLILDWKTNRIQHQELSTLVEIYEGQIRAYMNAWQAIFKLQPNQIQGLLYSTVHGCLATIEAQL